MVLHVECMLFLVFFASLLGNLQGQFQNKELLDQVLSYMSLFIQNVYNSFKEIVASHLKSD